MRVSAVFVRRPVVVAVLVVCVLGLLPGAAEAGSGGAATPDVPTTLVVGQTGVAASITLENRNTGAQAALTNTVCNNGDASPPCAPSDPGIVFVPSCSQLAAGQCTLAGKDPGVIVVSSAGTGRAGTACAGMAFTAAVIDAGTGATGFTPAPAGAHVTLPGFGSSCVIDFTVDVLQVPTADFGPATPGLQTAQVASFTSYTGALSNFATGTTSGVTITLATPTISTAASGTLVVGSGSISDTATVSGRVNPTGSPTVAFQLFGPDDATCSQAVFTSTVAYPVIGGPVTSASFTPSAPGLYRWIASYSGDANNAAVSGVCGDALEMVQVTNTTTTTTTTTTMAATTTTAAPTTTMIEVATTIAEPETTLEAATTTTGTIPTPDLTEDTLPVTGAGSGSTTSWALGLMVLGGALVVVASVHRQRGSWPNG